MTETTTAPTAPHSLAERLFFYLGLCIVAGVTMMLQVIETRILSVTTWYHLAFMVISMAMFGLTAGAVWVHLMPKLFKQERLGINLGLYSIFFAVATALSLGLQLNMPIAAGASLSAVFSWLKLAIVIAIPFFFSGVVISLALTRSPYPVGRVYGADLAGAALGCFGVLFLLNTTDGPSSIMIIAALTALAAWMFTRSGLGAETTRVNILSAKALLITFILLAAAVANVMAGGVLTPRYVKGKLESTQNVDFNAWNSFSRVTLYGERNDMLCLWGPVPNMPPEENFSPVKTRVIRIDADAGTCMYNYAGDKSALGYVKFDITNFAHYLPGRDVMGVIGVGAGRDVLSAHIFGKSDITGVELNPIIVDLLTAEDKYGAFSGIPDIENLDLHVDEARSWFARSNKEFDMIQMSLIDTWAATGAGAFTLSENGLYTVEAWKIFMRRLSENGVFTISRWYSPGDVNETGRMISLAVATLMERGAENPADHIFVVAGEKLATMMLANAPYTNNELSVLHDRADELGLNVLVSPREDAASDVLKTIINAPDLKTLQEYTSGLMLDLTPPRDARPFFFNQLHLDRPIESLSHAWKGVGGVFAGNSLAAFSLLSIMGVSLLLVTLVIILPMRPVIARANTRYALSGSTYFSLIGLGFMLVEIAMLQRMSVFLGHPVYSLSLVLFSLIFWTGMGSLASDKFIINTRGRLIGWVLLLSGYVLTLPLWLPDILLTLDSADLIVRGLLCVAVLMPAGFLMGFGFPTGMRLVSKIDDHATPWFWGINGAAGVLAGSIAVYTSIAFGIDATLMIGAGCYLLLIPAALAIGVLETAPTRETVQANA